MTPNKEYTGNVPVVAGTGLIKALQKTMLEGTTKPTSLCLQG